MHQRSRLFGTCAAILATIGLATPAQAQFGGLIRDLEQAARNKDEDNRTSDGCEEGKSQSTGSRVLGGIFGRTARKAARDVGLPTFVPVSEFSDQISSAIACKLDPEEQKQAAEATLEATRGADEDSLPAVGSTATWTSETREGVTGRSTVTAREELAAVEGMNCITVSDVIIVQGEETRADKRMCKPPGSARYSIVA